MSEKNLNETHKEAFEVARRAGLEKAVMEFPEDVLVAAEAAARARSAFPAPVSPNAEPWPPMKVSE